MCLSEEAARHESGDNHGHTLHKFAAHTRERERWFVMKILRSDSNEVDEYKVTVTSEHTHKRKEQRSRKEKRRLHPVEAVCLM